MSIKTKLKDQLVVGSKIKVGKQFSEEDYNHLGEAGSVITLVSGHFEYENGLYTEDQYAPSVWHKSNEDYSSIYHLFGNNLQNFDDCEVVSIEIPHGEWWMVECLKYGSQSVLKKVEGGWVNCCFDFQLHEPAASYKDDEMKPLYLMVRESV